MAAKIIPFPRFMQRHCTRQTAAASEQGTTWDTADGIHLVGTAEPDFPGIDAGTQRESQQEAFRIVREVQQEWNARHHASETEAAGSSSPRQWAMLPLPKPQRETPFTVVRRLMHVLLVDVRTA